MAKGVVKIVVAVLVAAIGDSLGRRDRGRTFRQPEQPRGDTGLRPAWLRNGWPPCPLRADRRTMNSILSESNLQHTAEVGEQIDHSFGPEVGTHVLAALIARHE